MSTTRVKGESLVWLTAAGLAVGLLMVIGLLAVVVSEGVGAFWPRPVERITLADGSVLYAEVIQERVKTDAQSRGGRELSLYTGNKEVFGQGFRWLDQGLVRSRETATGVVVLERREQGNAIGLPLRLLGGDSPLEAGDPAFHARLDQAIAEHRERHEAITRLGRDEIGAIARRSVATSQRLKGLEAGGKGADPEAAALRAELITLREAQQALAPKLATLRAQQKAMNLVLHLGDGSERRIPLAQMLGTTWSNDLGWTGRLGTFLGRVWHFVSDNPREANTEGGIFPAIFGTLAMTMMMSVAVTPFGVVAAIYLREYARQGPLVRAVRIAVNNLAGVPSIVFGVFGLGFFVYILGGSIDSLFFPDRLPAPTFGTGGVLWSALTLALMTVPVVIVATEESVAAVPRGMKEGSLACGASKWQTIQRIVLPAAVPGVLTGLILAMARGAGEVAPLMLVGVVKNAPTLPIDATWPFIHLDTKFMHLGFHIYDLGFQSPDSDAARSMVFATTLFLIGLVLVLNLGAIILRDRLRKRFATGAF